ncbi:MAG: hypothetical protein ACE5Q3_02870 [Alphaproteobacteria bacterium]
MPGRFFRIPYRRYAGASIALALLAAGCGVIVSNDDVTHQYLPQEVSTAGGSGNQIQVDVRGNPFAVPDRVLSEAVVSSMIGRVPGRRVDFALEPQQVYTPRHWVVMLFDPPDGARARRLCQTAYEPAERPVNGVTDVKVLGAFCRRGFALSWATGRAKDVSGPESPRFDQLIAQMTKTLFPRINRNLEEDVCDRFPERCPEDD